MKSAVKIILIAFVLMLSGNALKTFARTYSADEIKFNINNQVESTYKQYTDAEITSTVLMLPFQKLILPEGNVNYRVSAINDKFMARNIEKVQIYVNNKLEKTFNVPIAVKAYKNVLVASTQIDRDQALTPEVVTVKKMEVAQVMDNIVTSDMLSRDIVAKKLFRDGEVIDKRFVKLKPDVMKNNQVTAYFKTNALMVSIDATAMSNGMKGDFIGVQSKEYGKVYTAKVIGENKVLI